MQGVQSHPHRLLLRDNPKVQPTSSAQDSRADSSVDARLRVRIRELAIQTHIGLYHGVQLARLEPQVFHSASSNMDLL